MSKYKNYLKLNDKGKSPAFFLKKNQNYLTRKIINSLFDFSQKYKKDTRICLHSSKKSKIQFMINVLRKKEKYFYSYHPKVDEYYFILEGKLLIKYYTNKKIKKIILNKNNFTMFKMKNKMKHVTIPLTKKCMFIEVREGPFNSKTDSIFLKKYEKNI